MKKEILFILGFTSLFVATFFLFQYQRFLVVPPQYHLSWTTKLLSMLHTILIVGAITLFLSQIITINTWKFLININRGYLIATLIIHTIYPSSSQNIILDFIHHIVVFIISLYINKYPRYIALGFICEITQLPLYTTWYLVKWNLVGSTIFKILVVLTILAYLVFRVILFTYLLFVMWSLYRQDSQRTNLLEAIGVLPILALNYYWFGLLIQKATEQVC